MRGGRCEGQIYTKEVTTMRGGRCEGQIYTKEVTTMRGGRCDTRFQELPLQVPRTK